MTKKSSIRTKSVVGNREDNSLIAPRIGDDIPSAEELDGAEATVTADPPESGLKNMHDGASIICKSAAKKYPEGGSTKEGGALGGCGLRVSGWPVSCRRGGRAKTKRPLRELSYTSNRSLLRDKTCDSNPF